MKFSSLKDLPAFLREMIRIKILHRDMHKTYSQWQFDYVSKEYDESDFYEEVRADYPAILKELKKEPFDSLLDCGCGTGAILSLLSSRYPDRTFTGIDLSWGMLEAAKGRNLPNVTFIQGDCEDIPFPSESFDVILCNHSYHHYPHPQRFFNSAFRALKPGGRLIIRDNTGGLFYLAYQNIFCIPRNNFRFHHGDVRFYSARQTARFCRRAGFLVESMKQRKDHKLHGVARKEG